MAIIKNVTCPDGSQRAFHANSNDTAPKILHGFVKVRILGKRVNITGSCENKVFSPSKSAHFYTYFLGLKLPELRHLLNVHLSNLHASKVKQQEEEEKQKDEAAKLKAKETEERASEKAHKEGRGKSKRVSK